MPTLHTYRLFISHAWRYSEHYQRVVAFLDAANNFSYSNYSVPESNKFDQMSNAGLQEEIRDQIRPVQCVVVTSGMYVAHSEWIQFEIDFAKQLGKPIVGIKPWGSVNTPKAISDAADEIVGWNANTIVSAIRNVVP
ncbi:TIR domain-containing protein [Altericroceibacterium xinjiangense]|uniref:TIR domain-containing protein n=1 Tax=Altericroceibacterium xinjiangense TaxID=762261 RepID=UPI000F7D6BE5|nr:TIR domain-containing protein [Altericroceibacterium xinjiangense]